MSSNLNELIKKYTASEPIDFPSYLKQKKRELADYPMPVKEDVKKGYVVAANAEMMERMLYAKSFRQLGYETFIVEKPRGEADLGFIAIAPLNNDLEAILWLQTGLDFDPAWPIEIVKALALWRDYCNLHIIGAGLSWVEIDFETLPNNVESFANIIINFCEGVLSGPIRNAHDLAEHLQNERTITLRFKG
ncbi:MAG: DUF4253 domain-containing protein [Spirochaetaceae bacterium]|nr:DUF4253 domain-containing protein [Spirochaetaceae bacterium]